LFIGEQPGGVGTAMGDSIAHANESVVVAFSDETDDAAHAVSTS
jgi:hypothetical protein